MFEKPFCSVGEITTDIIISIKISCSDDAKYVHSVLGMVCNSSK